MGKGKSRRYVLEGDTVIVNQVYDNEIGQYRNDYPNFEKHPRITPTGRRWVSVFKENCPYSSSEYGDCGSCQYFRCEKQGDLIGICENDTLRVAILENVVDDLQRKEA